MTETKAPSIAGRRLAKNVVWNFFGLMVPILIGLISIPLLIDGMGKERFGLLTIIWMGVGYFTLFDMGLGRALTKLVSERLGQSEQKDLGPLIWTALWLILGLGILGALIVFIGAGAVVSDVLNVPPQLQEEAKLAFLVLAVGLPFVTLTAALRGLLEAHQKFALITAIRVPLGALTFLGPLITLQFSPSLVYATLAMLGGRIVATSIYSLFAASIQRELHSPKFPRVLETRLLVQFGGWLTVTNIIGPIMVYFDRFLIGSLQTLTAVTYYVTPYEVLSRLQILPGAVMGVLFPAMSAAQSGDMARMLHLYERTTRVLVVMMVPPVGFFFLFAPEALNLWLGPEFSENSASVVRWLALGWLVNVMAHAPLTALQTLGRPDLVAKSHLAELIPYLVILWMLTSQFGIAGTAAAWFIRVLSDTLLLNYLARRVMPGLSSVVRRTHLELFATLIISVAVYSIAHTLFEKVLVFVLILVVVAIPGYRFGQAYFRKNV